MSARPWEDPFLIALECYGNVAKACRLAGIARSAAYERRKVSDHFRAQWSIALHEYAQGLEARTRALCRPS